ncbi:MAG: transcriptional regulator, partial [Deltaproteobacteria bacterium]|nr:transcriptional regulator [Deltaproteobacteria bacterium]
MVSHFADCELDESLYQLRRNGAPVAVEPKVFDVLAYLLQHRDRVVSKDELLDKLWPGQVVGENALTRCIRAARAAVGDDGTKQAIIETQHGRGYRFVAFVTTDSQEDVSRNQQEDNQKAKSENGLESSVQSLESENRLSPTLDPRRESLDDSTPARSWSVRSSLFLGLLLLVGIITAVQYLSLP